MNLYNIEQTQQLERLAIEAGMSPVLLMKRAGWRAFLVAERVFPSIKRVYVLCGGGNNGGDGFAFAQFAHLAGWQVDVGLVVSPSQVKAGAATSMLTELVTLGIKPAPYDTKVCAQADVIVDAMFGIGLKSSLSADALSVIASVNAFNKPVLALDVPSGLNADTGIDHGDAIKATQTITFITHKQGLISADGPDVCGVVTVDDLGINVDAYPAVRPTSKLMDMTVPLFEAQERPKNSHKGDYGQALVIGGDTGMMGAITLTAQACAHAGAGVVRVVTRSENAPWITMKCPEVMAYGERQLLDLMGRSTVLAVGSGMVVNDWSKGLWQSLLAVNLPMIVDAGALRLLAAQPMRRDNWILTPHPGEAAALLGVTTEAVQADRLAAVVALHEKFGGVIVLKGAGTLVYDGGDAHLCDFADGAMSSSGMGDVLAGIITALVAQGLSLMQAALEGVMMHARAGEKLAESARVVLASAMVDALVEQ